MYEVFYKFRAEPFRLSPDHRFCFEHKGYAKARAYMAYAFKRAEGFVMVTGRPGTGKTTLIGEVVESLASDNVSAANLVCTQLQADDLLKSVAYSFGIGADISKAEILQRLNVLLNRWHREGRRALLIVDEAQNLSKSAMEELRLLTNIQLGGQPLLQIFLLGQPELRDLVLSPEMEQVHQRIVAASHLEGLHVDETEDYVIHRLQRVGWKGDPAIDRAIFPLIHKFSDGVPRRINLICSRLFLLGSVEERHAIGVEDMRVVISELQAENLAAGGFFSQEDFIVSGPTEWVPVPESGREPEEKPEVQLRAVGNHEAPSAYHTAPQSPDAPSQGIKKKDPPPIAPIPKTQRVEPPAPAARSAIAPKRNSGDKRPAAKPTPPSWPASDPELVTAAAAPPVAPVPTAHVPGGLRWLGILLLLAAVVAPVAYLSLVEEDAGDSWLPVKAAPPSDALPREVSSWALALPEAPADTTAVLPPVGAEDHAMSLSTSAEQAPFERPAEPDRGRPAAGGIELEQDLVMDASLQAEGDITLAQLAVLDTAPDAIQSGEEVLQMLDSNVLGQDFFVSFDFDSAELTPHSNAVLDEVAQSMVGKSDATASIIGFADFRGDESYNLVLSRERALAVKEYLVAAGVAQQRLVVEGRGAVPDAEDGAASSGQQRIVQIKLTWGSGR